MATDTLTERDAKGHVKVPSPDSPRWDRAIVLLSGGVDSTVLLGLACWTYREVHALGFWYGQRHSNELGYAKRIAATAGVPYHQVVIDAALWKQTPLCRGDIPTDRSVFAIRDGGIPSTFVPGRNVVFLSYACSLAMLLGGGADVLIGATAEDQTGYPDCRPAFVAAMNAVALTAGNGTPVHIRAPLVALPKARVVELGRSMAIDFSHTWSCYQPLYDRAGVEACGRCDACVLRAAALS